MIFYLLNKGQQTVKLLNNDETIESNLDEAINTASELEFSLPLQKRLDSNIYYILIPEYHGNDFLMFKVISEDVQKDRVEYSAVESAYDELKSYEYIKDIRPHQMNAAQMLQQVLKNTRWSLGYVEDTGIQSTTFYYITILEAIQKIVDLFKVELTFTIQLDPVTQKITGRKVNLYQQQGRRTGKRFEYGSNLLTVTREEDSQNLVTALVGRGKGVQVSGQDTEDTTDDGYGRRLTFADVEWKTSAGAPVNKPKGQEYVEDPKATALYGFSDGHPRIGLVTFDDIEDPNQLINATWSALLEAKRPKVSFKAEVTDVGNLQLGDTIAIIRHDLGIEYFTRVYKVHHNLKDENRNTVEMGDDFSNRSITSAISNAIQISQDATTIANTAAIAANGKNRNFYSNTKPLFANEGDNLFLNLGNGETEMWVWHHGQWEFVQSTVELHTVQKEVKEAQEGLKDAKKEIADNLAKADSDIAELNASIAGQNSKIDGLSASVNTVVIPKVTDITNQVSDVVTKVNEQKNIVTGLQNQATQQGKDISKITTDVHGVTVDLANLNGDVNQTKSTVQGLQTTLGNAQGDIAQIKVDAKKLSTSLSGKVDNSTYANFVSATNNALNAKLVASDLNGYAKTTDVQATANGLQVNINSVSGKLDNLVIGNRNLVRNSGFPINTDYWNGPEIANHAFYYSNTKPLFLLKNNSSGKNYAESAYFPLKRNTTYVASFKGFSFVNTSSYDVFILARKYGENNKYTTVEHVVDAKRLSPSGVEYIKDLIFNSGENDEAYIRFDNNGSTNNETSWLFFTEVKIEEGNKSTAWTPDPEDEQDRINGITSQLSAKITANSQQFSSYYTKTDIDEQRSSVQSQITQNATGLQSVVAKVDNIRIGGTNLIRDSLLNKYSHGVWISSGEILWHDNSNSVEIKKGDLIQIIPVEPNTTYTFSFGLAYQDMTDAWANQFFFVEHRDQECTTTTPNYIDHRWAGDQFPNTAGRKDKKLTFTTQADCHGLKMYIRQESTRNNPLHIFQPKLELGNQATDWSPAPEDKANQSDYSALNQTVKGIQSTVSSNYGNLQTQISQTAGTIRDEVTNKISGVQSQITQNVNNLNLRLNNVSRNLVLNSGNFQDLHGWYTGTNGALTLGKHDFWKNGSENVLWINNPSKTDEVTVSSARFDVVPHTTYTISFYAFASVNVTSSDLYFLGRKKSSNNDFDYVINPIALRRYSPSKAEYITATINTGDSEEGYIRFDNNGSTDGNGNLLGITDIQMEEGSVATPWKPAASDQVLAQINVAAGTTLIQNDKIYMDASSTVFSGKAFIPDAAITNISADKINTGTLDAGRINVINLNANNITTGTINGANLKINLNSGEILFQKGRIASTNGNLNIDIDSGTMSVTNWMNEGVYFKDGKLILDDRGFGGLIADNPKYGVIQRSNQMFNNNAFGMELNSPNGVSLRTSNYDGVINTGSGLDGTKNGAVISVDKDGSAVVNGAGTTFLTGGPKFSQSKYSIGTRPHIWIGTFNARLGDRIEIDANYIHLPTTYYRTTGSAPNLCIASDGALVRSTSASKYKTDIKRSYSTEYGEKLLNLPTAIWTDKGQKERYKAGKRHIKPEKYFGMIAEDLADAGLDLLVSRNPQTHEIEGIQYERIAPALLPVIKKLKDKVNRLEKQINER